MRRIVDRIVDRFHPERIILFGSRARRQAGPDSDVDLLVIMSASGSKRAKAVEIGVALHDIDLAKDILISTPEEYEWRKEIVGTIEHIADLEG
jgi:predicted nucleotidyltransferase